MKNTQLNRVLSLMRRTGDRCLILDSESEEVFAFLTLSDYERMLSGGHSGLVEMNEKEMMDKVNRDIANWRAYHEDEDFEEEKLEIPSQILEEVPISETQPAATKEKDEFPLKGEEEKLDDLSSEDQDTFLLEPV